ncbi:MAG: metal ABC transporter ATP-binding protein [Actinomycetota bacterium]
MTPSGGFAVAAAGVDAGYGGRVVLSRLDLSVDRGELLGVVGPSGSGKSTLLRLLTGAVGLYRGVLEVMGRPVERSTPWSIGFVPQLAAGERHFPLTVEQVVLLGLAAESKRSPWFSRQERRKARALIDRLGLGDHARRRIGELSGGQQQRALLARAMVRDPALLLLDEPTSGVDLASRAEVLRLLDDLNRDGLTILLTTHDLNWVAAHLPRVVCLHGNVKADGPPAEVLTPRVLAATFEADLRIVRDGDAVLLTDASPLLVPR